MRRVARPFATLPALCAAACVAHAQAAAPAPAASAPLWNIDYRDCAEHALARLVPEPSASTPSPQQPVAQAEHDCADRLPTPGADTSALTVDAVVAIVHSGLMQHFSRRPITPQGVRPATTIDVGHGVTCPQPDYPPAALRMEATGQTQLELRVDGNGHLLGGNILVASGTTREHRLLDGAALEAFAQCTFPASGEVQRMRLAFVWRLRD